MIRTSCKKTKAAVAALLALVLLLGSSFGAFAIGSYGDENYALIDEANIFTDEQMTSLCDKLSAAGSKTDWQLAVVTTNDNVSSSRMDKYYNNYYDNNRNVFEADCVMFVIDNASSNRIILTHGTAESYFTDERLTEMKSALKPSLASGDMVSAVQIFADTSVSFYEQGIPSDGHHSNHVEGKVRGGARVGAREEEQQVPLDAHPLGLAVRTDRAGGRRYLRGRQRRQIQVQRQEQYLQPQGEQLHEPAG